MVWEVVSHSASSDSKLEVVITPQDFHMMGTLLGIRQSRVLTQGWDWTAGQDENSQGPMPALICLGSRSGQDQSFGNRARHGVIIRGALLTR